MLQAIIHYSLHFIAPALLAYVFFGRERFWSAYGVMLLSMAVDLDHLLANPIFDPHRMSIGFHPLHSYHSATMTGAVLSSATSIEKGENMGKETRQ